MQSRQLDLTRHRLPRRRRYACDVCGRPRAAWEITLRIGGGDRVDRCMIEHRCDQHFWRPGRTGTHDVSFR
jgi:hypothetical protein